MFSTQLLVDTNNQNNVINSYLLLSSFFLFYLSELKILTLFITLLFIFCLTAKFFIKLSYNIVKNLHFFLFK